MNNTELVELIAEQLFNQSCEYNCGFLSFGWNNQDVQRGRAGGTCRRRARDMIAALKVLNLEIKPINRGKRND